MKQIKINREVLADKIMLHLLEGWTTEDIEEEGGEQKILSNILKFIDAEGVENFPITEAFDLSFEFESYVGW